MSDRISDIRRTFALFSAAEIGVWPTWSGPSDPDELLARTILLGVLLRAIPPGELTRLDQLAKFLSLRFPHNQVVPLQQLRTAVYESLGWNADSDKHLNTEEPACRGVLKPLLQQWNARLQTDSKWTHLKSSIPGGAPRPIQDGYIERVFARRSLRDSDNQKIPAWGQDHDSILMQSAGRCLIVAGPGEGKSTLVQRIAHSIAMGQARRFKTPIVIDGASYGNALCRNHDLTPLQFFFTQLGLASIDVRTAADAFRRLSPASTQAIFLLDDCDAVPDSLQYLAQSHLAKDAEGHAILMTARSPPLFETTSALCYRMVPLSRFQSKTAIQRTLCSSFPDVPAELVTDQLVNQLDFRSIISNPHWLSMLTVVIAGMYRSGFPVDTMSALEQLVAWERARCAGIDGGSIELNIGHIQALAQTAFLCCNRSETDSFSRHECEVIAADFGVDAAEILRSRFVHQSAKPLERYRFAEDAFQRYFASHYVANALKPYSQEQFFDDAMCNPAKLPIFLGALHRSPDLRMRCQSWVANWLSKPDCFDQVISRVAQVVVAANYDREDLAGPVPEICERLWIAAKRNFGGEICRRLIDQLAALDRTYLIRKLTNLRDSDSTLFSSLAGCVSADIAVAVGSCVAPASRGNQFREDAEACATIVGLEQALLRIALLPTDHPQVQEYLMQLVGRPIDCQFEVLMQFARSPRADATTRTLAIQTLAGCDESCDLSPLAELLHETTNPKIAAALIELARSHSIPLNRHHLERQIEASVDPKIRQACLQAYVKSVERCEFAEAKTFLSRLACKAFRNHDVELLDCLWCSLSQADLPNLDRWLDHQVDASATDHLLQFVRGANDCDLEIVSMAATWLSIRLDDRNRVHLRAALEKTLLQTSNRSRTSSGQSYRNLASVLAASIVRRDPSILMGDLWEQPVVVQAFARTAWAEGWLVYRDRIVNANGATIAVKKDDALAQASFSTPEVVLEIAKQLSPRQRNDFLSYWHMVSEGGDDYANCDRKTVYQAMCMVLESELNTSLSERLLMCYQDGKPPKFSTWKKNLVRVVQRCVSEPQWLAHLQKIGLGTYRNSSDRSQW